MEKSIQQFFFDKDSHIYVVDENGILYLFLEGTFYPFLTPLSDIKECFSINNLFFVYHSHTISIFDENLHIAEYTDDFWITQNIDELCYNPIYKIIVTMENQKVHCNYNVSAVNYFEDVVHQEQLVVRNKYQSIKIINDMLLTLSDYFMDIYFLTNSEPLYIRSLYTDPIIFKNLSTYSETHLSFSLDNGDLYLSSGILKKIMGDGKIINKDHFEEKIGYFAVNGQHLICCYNKENYKTIVEPIISLLSINKTSVVDHDDREIMVVTLAKKNDIIIKNNEISQVMLINKKIYFISNHNMIYEAILKDELIQLEEINKHFTEKNNGTIFVDIDITKSVMEQLLNIIPSIYRLSNESNYIFEHIDLKDKIISYGDGTTRQTFDLLRKELNAILKNNFNDVTLSMCYNLGKLFYFCVIEGGEKFTHIHPYFFYAIIRLKKSSKDNDYITLLKKFKGDKFELYKNQYLEYKTNRQALVDLNIGLESADDYIKYIIFADLTEETINMYNQFVKGFYFFAIRNRYDWLIRHMSISYYIDTIIVPSFFSVDITFSKIGGLDDTQNFLQFCNIFTDFFNKLTDKQLSFFSQNITGSQYYNKIIKVIYAYNNTKSYITRQDDTNNEVIHEIENDTQVLTRGLTYEISTCNAQIIFYAEPTIENIENIINHLTIEDLSLKN